MRHIAVKLHRPLSDEGARTAMSQHPENQHHIRRVVLPSGKTIEVVYFEDAAAATEAPRAHDFQSEQIDLHVCGRCDSEMVYPVEWDEAGATHWEVTLRCPNCEWNGTGVYEQELVERFDEELDRGTEALVRDLKRLMQANMEDEIDRFILALSEDHVLPEDF